MTTRPPGFLRRTFFAAALTLILVAALNLLAAVGYDGRFLLERWIVPVSDKAHSPALTGDPARVTTIFREFDALRTRYQPYFAWSREAFNGETTTVAADGDRVHKPRTDSPAEHIRIFGGSTIWGKGVDDEGTIPAQLNALRPDSAVHNHGESGFVSRQSLARLINILNQDEATDVVVFYDGCNDLYTLCRDDISINGHSRETKIRDKMTPRSATSDALVGALREVIAYLFLQAGVVNDAPSRCADDPEYARRVAVTMVNNWRIAQALAAARGIEFHAFLQPIATAGDADADYLELDDKLDEPRSRSYRTVYPIVQQIIASENVSWMHDLSDSFRGAGAVYIDSCHVNEEGNAIIASRLDRVLRQ